MEIDILRIVKSLLSFISVTALEFYFLWSLRQLRQNHKCRQLSISNLHPTPVSLLSLLIIVVHELNIKKKANVKNNFRLVGEKLRNI